MKNPATSEAFALVGRKVTDEETATAKAIQVLAEIDEFNDERSRLIMPLGIEVSENSSGIIYAVHLHSEGHEGFNAFPFEFEGLTFASNRGQARDKLGSPIHTGFGRSGPWDAFHQNKQEIHFMYSPDAASIVLVTVSNLA